MKFLEKINIAKNDYLDSIEIGDYCFVIFNKKINNSKFPFILWYICKFFFKEVESYE